MNCHYTTVDNIKKVDFAKDLFQRHFNTILQKRLQHNLLVDCVSTFPFATENSSWLSCSIKKKKETLQLLQP